MNLSYRQRLGLLAALGVGGAFLLAWRLATVQLVEHDHWALRAQTRSAQTKILPGERGRILDAKGRVLAEDVVSYDLAVVTAGWDGRLHECPTCAVRRYYVLDARYERTKRVCWRCKDTLVFRDERDLTAVARLLKKAPHELLASIEAEANAVAKQVERELKAHTAVRAERKRVELRRDHGWRPRILARNVPYEVAREVELHPYRNPAFRVLTGRSRASLGGAPFVHMLGLAPRGQSGGSGLERALDHLLRSEPGFVTFERDSRGDSVNILDERAPLPGIDVRLTLDAEVQGMAYDALRRSSGALVVVEAETGAVLALATAPSYEPERYRATLKDWLRPERQRMRDHTPLIDRAFANAQIPGSILKPITALAALRTGAVTPRDTFVCDRYFTYRGKRFTNAFKCHAVHGEVDLERALVKSCNIYFESAMVRMLDAEQYPEFLALGRAFGLGEPTGIEIEPRRAVERSFRVPDGTRIAGLISSAIGQGPLVLTPAQVARAYAGLATGRLPDLHLVARTGDRATRPHATALPDARGDLTRIRAALRGVTRPGGTADEYGLSGWDVSCKTGTAQRGDAGRYNSWIAGYAPAQAGRPALAFAMVVLDTPRMSGDACGPRLHAFFTRFYREVDR